MLSNEKYISRARLLDSISGVIEYFVDENNPQIVRFNTFTMVQEEKKKRSNLTKNEDGAIRKDKKYSYIKK